MKTKHVPICADCNVAFIVSQLPISINYRQPGKPKDDVVRLLCPKCRGMVFGVMDDEHGFRKIVSSNQKGCDKHVRED